MKKMKKGFTIVELVIVIGVIAILSAILIPTFVNLNKKAKDAALRSDLASAYSMYAADAADGYRGEEESLANKILLKSQEKVRIQNDGSYYCFTGGEWSLTPVEAPTLSEHTWTGTDENKLVAGDAGKYLSAGLYGSLTVYYVLEAADIPTL